MTEWSKESEGEKNVQATNEQNSGSVLHFFHKNLTWSAISRGPFYGTVTFTHALPRYKHLSVLFVPYMVIQKIHPRSSRST